MIAATGCPSSRRAGRTVTLSAPVFSWQICCLAVADDDVVTLEHCRYRISETVHGRCTHPCMGPGRRFALQVAVQAPGGQLGRNGGVGLGSTTATGTRITPSGVACIPQRTGRLAPWAPGDTSQRMSSNSRSRTEDPHHGCPARHVRAADARQSRQAGTVPGAHFRQRFGGRCPAIADGKGNAPWCAR